MLPKKHLVIIIIAATVLIIASVLVVVLRPRHASVQKATASSPSIDSKYLKDDSTWKLGRHLTDPQGMTLYISVQDTRGWSRCDAECQLKWLPYGPDANDTSAESMAKLPANLGISRSPYGQIYFTWQDHPLYRFVEDKAPGDAKGVDSLWRVVEL